MDLKSAIDRLKKLSFHKSWQDHYIGKEKEIINLTTGKPETTTLDVFIYVPTPSILKLYSNDREFLAFRMENKYSSDYNFNLIADKTENNNRRLAVMYVAQFLNTAEISFLIDSSYTIYITGRELEKLAASEKPELKDFYNSFYIPKHFGGRKGSEETFS